MTEEFSLESAAALFPKRKEDAHKGLFGRAVLIGGSVEYSGAAKLAAMACSALRSGAGLCTLCVPKEVVGGVLPFVLENTICPLPSQDGHLVFNVLSLQKAISGATAVAFGMGVGIHEGNAQILDYLLHNFSGRLILDADALNTLAKHMELLNNVTAQVIITPHYMEFSRLSGKTIDEIKENPANLAGEFAKRYRITVLLKGNVTYISDCVKTVCVKRGSPGMAKGGSGDVLSGIIAGIAAHAKSDALSIAATGATIAGIAGELATAKLGEYSMLASDEVKEIPAAILGLSGC